MVKLLAITSKLANKLSFYQLLAVLFLVLTKGAVICTIGLFMAGLASPEFMTYAKYTLCGAGFMLMACLYCSFYNMLIESRRSGDVSNI